MKEIHAILIAISIVVMVSTGVAVAQITPTETSKRYTTCINSIPELDSMNLRYDISGCPISDIIIHDYNRLTDIQKQTIDTALESKGYVEKEEFDTNEGTTITSK